MKVAFFGTPRLAQIVLEKLIDSPYKPSFVVTAPDTKSGRGQKVNQSPVKQTATMNGIETLESLTGVNPAVGSQNTGLTPVEFDLAILVAYGKIIPKEILAIPRFGFINVHPSLLPKYRGPSPIQSAILDGEEKTGVTIIKLDEIVDHGPILGQQETPIAEDDTHASLIEKLGSQGATLLLETLPRYLDNSFKPKHQDHSKATFTEKITKKDGEIDLNNPQDPQKLDRMIRAYYPWPTVWSRLNINGKLLTVKFLPDNLIQPEGKRTMTIKEFLNGYHEAKKSIAGLVLK